MTKEYAEGAYPDEASTIIMGSDDTEERTQFDTATIESDDQPRKEKGNVPSDKAAGEADDGGGDRGSEEGDGASPLSDDDLTSFDSDDEEQVARYDEAFANEDGTLDMEGRLTDHFWANIEAGKEGLDEGIYQYLESKGIKKSTVKQIEAMAVTNQDAQENASSTAQKHDAALFEVAGGSDALAKALAWGKEGGYSKEQQERFNKVTAGKDLDAKKEAVELLMSRYNKANPPRRPRVPSRDATQGGGKKVNNALPFKDRAEMKQMRNSLRDNDHAGWALFKKRRAASAF